MFVVCGLWQQTSIVIYCFHMGSKTQNSRSPSKNGSLLQSFLGWILSATEL